MIGYAGPGEERPTNGVRGGDQLRHRNSARGAHQQLGGAKG